MIREEMVILAILILTPVPVCGQDEPASSVNLHSAALQGNLQATRQHIEAGSDLNERDAWGSTPLMVATVFGKTEVAMALIEAGADLNATNADGGTALHAAAFFCRPEIVTALVDNGANRLLRNDVGNMAFDGVAAPFDDVKGIYDRFGRALAPLGLELDYERIQATRPRIAQMLRQSTDELETVSFAPVPGGDWRVSTPAEQGLDPTLVAELYLDATGVETLYGLLVIKNGRLVAEGYFHEGSVEQLSGRQSVTKSFVSALVGIALDRGCLESIDQKMIDFFPELADQMDDPRKLRISIRDLLQMRAGYPDEQTTPPYFENLFLSDDWHWVPHIADFPLVHDPGTAFAYSNLTSHILGVIVSRACRTDLESYSQHNLFSPIGAKVADWTKDADGYNWGCNEIYLTGRDMAKFGLLYLNKGEFEGKRVIDADWVEESLSGYSEGMYANQWQSESSRYPGPYFRDVRYGYQWWSARVGSHHLDFAWGHGGNLIVLLPELDMVVVTTADPLHELPGEEGWQYEGALINLVGKFIGFLPKA